MMHKRQAWPGATFAAPRGKKWLADLRQLLRGSPHTFIAHGDWQATQRCLRGGQGNFDASTLPVRILIAFHVRTEVEQHLGSRSMLVGRQVVDDVDIQVGCVYINAI